MFERFVAAAPAAFPVRVQALPSDRHGYEELAEELLPRLPAEPFALIAESFSGPLAVLLANRCPRARAVVLCASFVRSPLPRFLGRAPEFVWCMPPPRLALQVLMTGGDHVLAGRARDTVATVDGSIIRARVEAALSVDVTEDLRRLAAPLLCLRAERDRLLPARCAAEIRAIKPSARIAGVPGPHLILQARPDQSWRLIAPFLEGAFTPAAG